MEITRDRLEREFDLDLISTAPNVVYEVLMEDGSEQVVTNPSEYPEGKIAEVREPVVKATILSPSDYIGTIMELCQTKRGNLQGMDYLSEDRVEMRYTLPMGEIVFDFFDQLKSRTKGYASLDYERSGEQAADLVKVDILLQGEPVDAFSAIVHRDTAYAYGVMMAGKLKDLIPRQQFEVPIQAAIGARVIARENIRAIRKDVLAKCYGGDITRKRKLLEKQKEGKKRMKMVGRVEVPQEAFIAALSNAPTGEKSEEVSQVRLPDDVLAFAERGPEWAAYVDSLPASFRDLLAEWELRPGDETWFGFAAVVVPVLTADGESAVLKVAYPDDETEHEALALQHWGGRGAVRLLRADPRRRAVLLERLDRTDLTTVPDLEACRVVAGLYPLLHIPAPPQLRTVTAYVGRWLEPMRALPRDAPIPHRMVEQWLSLVADLTADPRSTGRIVHADLHHENVLAVPDGGWRVIDPQAMSGDVHYELAPMLFNRWEEVAGDVRQRGTPPLPHPRRRGRAGRGARARLGRGADGAQRLLGDRGRRAARPAARPRRT